MWRTLVLLVVTLLLLGSARSERSGGGEVSFEEILFGDLGGGYGGPTDFVIRNPRQWCDFWRQAHSRLIEPLPCDRSLVDFRRDVVIASAFGGPNGCFGVEITDITAWRRHRYQHQRGLGRDRGRGRLRVFVRDIVPGTGCICTQSLVFPVRAVVVSKPVGRVRFVHQAETLQCPGIASPR